MQKLYTARPIAGVVHQFVGGGTQQRVTGVAAPQCAVNQALRMFHPETDRERLGLQRHATLMQHGKGVASTVAQRQNDLVSAHFFGVAAGLVQYGQAA
jgi:hypothetical protein